jgi:hypothetical protein
MASLAQRQFCMKNLEILAKRRAGGFLHAVVGPGQLAAIGNVDRLVRRLAGMRGGEAEVAARMSILRQPHMRELCRQAVDQRHYLVPVRHRQAAAGGRNRSEYRRPARYRDRRW